MTDHDDIRLGTLTHFSAGGDYIRQIRPHGFESFQIFNWGKLPDGDLEKLAGGIRDAAGDSVISSIGMFGNPILSAETAAAFAKCIGNARAWFGCDLVCGFTGAVDGKSVPESMPEFKRVWTDLAKRAEDKGVRICFETCDMDGTWGQAKWNIAHSPVAWEMMFNELGSPAVGLEWEPCHQLKSFVDPIPQLRKWLPKIWHLHGKDATVAWDVIREYGTRSGKQFHWHRHPGFGDTNWSTVIDILRMAKWRGSIDIEGWHDPVYIGDLEMTGQVRSLNYLKECRGGPFVANPK